MRKLFYILLFIPLGLNGQSFIGAIASSSGGGGGGGSSTLLNGLVAGYKLDETSGNAADVLGSYTGTSSNITYTASGKVGRCYTFNGTSSYVSFGNVIKPTTAITLSAWVKTSNTASDNVVLDCHMYGTNWEGYSLIVYSDGAVGFFLGSNTATMLDVSTNPLYPTGVNDGNWHHIVATWDGTNAYIYVDNIASDATAYSTDIVYDASNELYMGVNPAGANWFSGDIDMVYVWRRALGVAGVDSLYAKQSNGIDYTW